MGQQLSANPTHASFAEHSAEPSKMAEEGAKLVVGRDDPASTGATVGAFGDKVGVGGDEMVLLATEEFVGLNVVGFAEGLDGTVVTPAAARQTGSSM